jgi:hypothetical protein
MESVSFSFKTETEGKRMEMNLHGEVAQDFHHLVKERIIGRDAAARTIYTGIAKYWVMRC